MVLADTVALGVMASQALVVLRALAVLAVAVALLTVLAVAVAAWVCLAKAHLELAVAQHRLRLLAAVLGLMGRTA